MGSPWKVDIWDHVSKDDFSDLSNKIQRFLSEFDEMYSRFSDTSLISDLANSTGNHTVPKALVDMLRIYNTVHTASHGAFNPLIGNTLSDLGYDKEYSLKAKESITHTPHFSDVVTIIDDTTIALSEKVLIDIGAVGKGFAVDRIADILDDAGVKNYLVDGSGDMLHRGAYATVVGLEHPDDISKVIAKAKLQNKAMASSGSNRRAWGKYHHIVNPHTRTSPDFIKATWVLADNVAEADALATALFLVPPEVLLEVFSFEYILVNKHLQMKRSDNWDVEFFKDGS